MKLLQTRKRGDIDMTWIILGFCMLLPSIMIILGMIFSKTPPKKMNKIAGYRTEKSMKSQETWDFANRYAGKLFIKWGSILLIFSILIPFMVRNALEDIQALLVVALVVLQTVIICFTIIPVEKALKENFDEQGLKRQEQTGAKNGQNSDC